MATLNQLEKRIKELESRVSVLEGEPNIEPEKVSAKSPKAKDGGVKVENLGFKIFGGVGFLLILLSLFYGYSYAVDQGYLGVVGRIVSGIILSAVVISAGQIFRHKNYDRFGQLLMGGGFALLYFTVYAMYHFREFREALGISLALDVILLFVVIVLAIWLGLKINSKIMTFYAFILGYITSIVTSSVGSHQMLISALLLTIGLAYLLKWKKWGTALYPLGATYIVYLFYYFSNGVFNRNPGEAVTAFVYLLIFYVLFQLLASFMRYDDKKVPDVVVATVSSALTLLFGLPLFYAHWDATKGLFVFVLAVAHMALVLLSKAREKEYLVDTHVSLGIVMLLIAIPVQLNGEYIALLWSLIGLFLFVGGLQREILGIRILGYVALLLAFGRSLLVDTWSLDYGFRTVSFVLTTAVLVYVGVKLWITETETKEDVKNTLAGTFLVATFLMVLIFVPIEVMDKTGMFGLLSSDGRLVLLSVVWAVFAIASTITGYVSRIITMRVLGAILFAIVVLKILIFDLSSLDTLARSVVTIIVGSLALGGSFVYVKNQDKIKEILER